MRVEVKPPAEVPQADVLVIRPSELGAPAARGELTPVPPEVRSADHPLQWNRIAVPYRSNLSSWGEEVLALPLAGDGYALVYRADKFADEAHRRAYAQRSGGRSLEPPATWEDVADVAAYFADADKRPSLPPLPSDPHRLLAEFQHRAACYDRPARSESNPAGESGTSFHVQSGTWRPRLSAPAFVAAAAWFAQTRPYRMPDAGGADPVRALDGPAVLAVLSLAEIARLRDPSGEVPAKFRVAPLPGTRAYFDAGGKRADVRQVNAVPFLGFGGQVGAVPKKSPHAAAAWDLLAELAGPAGSAAAVSAPGAGVGPFRTEHVDPAREQVWLGYGFDAERTKDLAAAMRRYLGGNVTNPA
ncbi:MAG: extracellular solute-binding protein, partial [Actinobacteria bacterium]|nr:extracellular solute-binding protein [Actinomycetota bacterium]